MRKTSKFVVLKNGFINNYMVMEILHDGSKRCRATGLLKWKANEVCDAHNRKAKLKEAQG